MLASSAVIVTSPVAPLISIPSPATIESTAPPLPPPLPRNTLEAVM